VAFPLASRRALRVHLAAAVVVPGCLALTWWQATRAAGGNTLSWAYTFEWPLFAAYAVYMWWRLVHDPDDVVGTRAEATAADADVPGGRPGPLPTGAGDGGPRGAEVGADAPSPGPDGPDGADDAEDEDEDEDELTAYNRYLAALNASGRTKHW